MLFRSGAGGLALVPGELGEGEAGAVAADLRREGEEAFIYAAKLLGAEVLVVHGAEDFPLAGEGRTPGCGGGGGAECLERA